MITFVLANLKGGCGKSNSVFSLSGCYAQLGRRVLLLDCDPQGSLSSSFWTPAITDGAAGSPHYIRTV